MDRVPSGPVEDVVHGGDEGGDAGPGVVGEAGRAMEGAGGEVVLITAVVPQRVAPPDLLRVGGLGIVSNKTKQR